MALPVQRGVTRLRGTFVLFVITVGIAGCGNSAASATRTQPNGAWTGCGNLANATVVQVHRPASLFDRRAAPLSVTQSRAALVRRLYYDFCVIVGHPADLPSNAAISCPADRAIAYQGAFYAGKRKLMTFAYAATGCQTVKLSDGSVQASTMIVGKAFDAEPPSFAADLAAVIGVRPDQVSGPEWGPAVSQPAG